MISFFTAPTTSLCTSSAAVVTSRCALSNVTACLQCGHFANLYLQGPVDLPTTTRFQPRRLMIASAVGSSCCEAALGLQRGESLGLPRLVGPPSGLC
jgi:hypothetical protein